MAQTEQEATIRLWPRQLLVLPPSLLAVFVALLSLLVVYIELPGRPLILHSLQKLGHPLVFGLVTLGLFGIRRHRQPDGSALSDYLPTLLVATALGFFTEVSQVVSHRDPALRDVMLDVRGIACALAVLAAFDPRLRSDHRGGRRRTWFLGVALLIAAITLAPISWVTAAYVNRAITAPALFLPRNDLDLLLVSLTDTAPELGNLPAAYAHYVGEKALRVPLTTRPYAGVSLDEPFSDWRAYHVLRLDVTNPTRSELPLHIRVQDRLHDGNYTDRFEQLQVLGPTSRRTLEIPLVSISTAPEHRRLDLSQISVVSLYKAGGEGAREIWVSRLELR
jgi:hypothetical protein